MGPGFATRRAACGGIAGRNINAMISGESVRNGRWWARNQKVIKCLGKGKSVREVADITGMSKRQVRAVKERLRDLWAQTEEETNPAATAWLAEKL